MLFMAAPRCHITIQRAAIGSEIKTLSTTPDGDGSTERETEIEREKAGCCENDKPK